MVEEQRLERRILEQERVDVGRTRVDHELGQLAKELRLLGAQRLGLLEEREQLQEQHVRVGVVEERLCDRRIGREHVARQRRQLECRLVLCLGILVSGAIGRSSAVGAAASADVIERAADHEDVSNQVREVQRLLEPSQHIALARSQVTPELAVLRRGNELVERRWRSLHSEHTTPDRWRRCERLFRHHIHYLTSLGVDHFLCFGLCGSRRCCCGCGCGGCGFLGLSALLHHHSHRGVDQQDRGSLEANRTLFDAGVDRLQPAALLERGVGLKVKRRSA